jgi:hypothetical protein
MQATLFRATAPAVACAGLGVSSIVVPRVTRGLCTDVFVAPAAFVVRPGVVAVVPAWPPRVDAFEVGGYPFRAGGAAAHSGYFFMIQWIAEAESLAHFSRGVRSS